MFTFQIVSIHNCGGWFAGIEQVVGDMFEKVPSGCDAIFMKVNYIYIYILSTPNFDPYSKDSSNILPNLDTLIFNMLGNSIEHSYGVIELSFNHNSLTKTKNNWRQCRIRYSFYYLDDNCVNLLTILLHRNAERKNVHFKSVYAR